MLELRTKPGEKLIELGGGANPRIRPNVDCRFCQDANGNQTVDFTADFNEILPIQSDEFDGVFSQFTIEHLSWRSVPQFVSEIFRILKPGGKAVIITANTEAQFQFIKDHPQGWDGKDDFASFSCVLFGDQDYPENTHRNFMSFSIAQRLFMNAGFTNILTQSYGDAETDMLIEAVKPGHGTTRKAANQMIFEDNQFSVVNQPAANVFGTNVVALQKSVEKIVAAPPEMSKVPREELFNKDYFNGGGKWGGYAREGYRDFPVHEITARHILARKPESVLELGAARGYVLKRIEDAGIPSFGLEISKHCYMTRVMDSIICTDICAREWPSHNVDLCYSVATLEHIPVEFLPHIFQQMKDNSKRGLHGIDFGEKDDGFDKTHCTLKPKEWWRQQFDAYGLQSHEIVDKEELEKGDFPADVLNGDGKVKLNIGSFTTMWHHGWINMDIHDVSQFAQQNGYKFQQCDVRNGIPYNTNSVDLITCVHMLEHLTYEEGLKFLRECRRVLKSDTGAIRIQVPDARLLIAKHGTYNRDGDEELSEFDEINEGCANSPTSLGKLWSLLHAGHSAAYDAETLGEVLWKAGFEGCQVGFREWGFSRAGCDQILKETLDTLPCLTLYMEGIPRTS